MPAFHPVNLCPNKADNFLFETRRASNIFGAY